MNRASLYPFDTYHCSLDALSCGASNLSDEKKKEKRVKRELTKQNLDNLKCNSIRRNFTYWISSILQSTTTATAATAV